MLSQHDDDSWFSSMKTLKVKICGRVQGVAFREYTRRQAHTLGLTGWVRNLPDGAVEAVIQGEPATLHAMQTWLQTGSPYSDVKSLAVEKLEHSDVFNDFSIRFY